jgi:hypothetical protein
VDAELAGFVGSRTDNASTLDAADDHRLAAQVGPVTLLDGRIESVHIDMNYRRIVVHGAALNSFGQRSSGSRTSASAPIRQRPCVSWHAIVIGKVEVSTIPFK